MIGLDLRDDALQFDPLAIHRAVEQQIPGRPGRFGHDAQAKASDPLGRQIGGEIARSGKTLDLHQIAHRKLRVIPPAKEDPSCVILNQPGFFPGISDHAPHPERVFLFGLDPAQGVDLFDLGQ